MVLVLGGEKDPETKGEKSFSRRRWGYQPNVADKCTEIKIQIFVDLKNFSIEDSVSGSIHGVPV